MVRLRAIMIVIVTVSVIVCVSGGSGGGFGELAFGGKDVDFHGVNPAAVYATRAETGVETHTRNGLLQHLQWDARIHQCGEEHVAADAGETIEICNFHEELSGSLAGPAVARRISEIDRTAFIEPER